MTEIPGFVVHSPPRTKKNHSRVISIPTKGARRCERCGHMPGFPKVMPSEAYQEWEAAALRECLGICAALRARGVELPIAAPVSVEALIYRDRDSGDAVGYYQAIGDMLQAAGILADDRLIEDWDGSRRLIDRANPRVEIYVTLVGNAPPVQESLL